MTPSGWPLVRNLWKRARFAKASLTPRQVPPKHGAYREGPADQRGAEADHPGGQTGAVDPHLPAATVIRTIICWNETVPLFCLSPNL